MYYGKDFAVSVSVLLAHLISSANILLLSAIYQGHPTDRFDKLSVRKALNPLRFSKGDFHLELL